MIETFGWDEVELGIVTKLLIIVSVLLLIIALVFYKWCIDYMSVTTIPTPLSFDFWVFLQYSVFWVKVNGIIMFRINTAAEISLIALVFASWSGLFSLWMYFLFIYQLKRKGNYRTFGDAKKRLKYIMVSGSKKEKAVVFASIIVPPANGIYLTIFLFGLVGLVGSAVAYGIPFFFMSLVFCRVAIWIVIR